MPPPPAARSDLLVMSGRPEELLPKLVSAAGPTVFLAHSEVAMGRKVIQARFSILEIVITLHGESPVKDAK